MADAVGAVISGTGSEPTHTQHSYLPGTPNLLASTHAHKKVRVSPAAFADFAYKLCTSYQHLQANPHSDRSTPKA